MDLLVKEGDRPMEIANKDDLNKILRRMGLQISPLMPAPKSNQKSQAEWMELFSKSSNQTISREQMIAMLQGSSLDASQDQMVICDTNKENLDSIGVVVNGKTNTLLYPKEWTIGNLSKINETNEDFAKDYIKMLLIKEELIEADAIVEKQNRMSSLLFRV
jgi:hypothetical protein